MPEPMKDLDNLKPIDHAVPAKPHTAVYKMHRYFARRPWSVFRALVEHYSNPGSIVLDPFCGGGVTVVEGLRLGRSVVGVDLSPMAVLITWMEVAEVDLERVGDAFQMVLERAGPAIADLFSAHVSDTDARLMHVEWFEWSNAVECSTCHAEVEFAAAYKISGGRYRCPSCGKPVVPASCKRLASRMVLVAGTPTDGGQEHIERPPIPDDMARLTAVENNTLTDSELSAYVPDAEIPDANLVRESALYDKEIRRFSDLFTPRQLAANACLLKAITETRDPFGEAACQMLALVFSDMLRWSNKMCYRKKGKPVAWGRHDFWPPEVFVEIDPLKSLNNRFAAFVRGREEIEGVASRTRVTRYLECPDAHIDLSTSDVHLVRASADRLPLEDESVDVIITDPPYGGSNNYLELANFWTVWHHSVFGLPPLTDRTDEAIADRHTHFAGAKTLIHYRDKMRDIFAECWRVLKPGRWMVMTFHNREFKVWNALHLAAHDAGFVLSEHDGMIYQPSIKAYDTAVYLKREGSMLGDFILSFQKTESPPEFKQIEHAEIGRHIERLAAEAVLHHHGASLSTIYMKLMPWLLNNNLLDKIGEKELLPYLQQNFEEHDGIWRLKPEPDKTLQEELKQYSQEHYKASYEELDFVPIEARIEYLIRRLLYGQGAATQDEILNQIYTNLINSNMAEVREIQRVLESIAKMVPLPKVGRAKRATAKGGRKVWRLREDIDREQLFKEMGADVQYRLASSEESDHDLAIARLVEIGGERKVKAHIGRTEQSKYTEFRHMSSDLPQRIKGLPKAARAIIEQIDVLWHNGGRGIVAAFEVERTTTITSGLQRFRDLLAAVPDVQIGLYLVIPKSRAALVRRKLTSPANRKEGLDRKVGYVYFEDLKIHARGPWKVDFDKIVHFVGEK